jgi:hypothetical protein
MSNKKVKYASEINENGRMITPLEVDLLQIVT